MTSGSVGGVVDVSGNKVLIIILFSSFDFETFSVVPETEINANQLLTSITLRQ